MFENEAQAKFVANQIKAARSAPRTLFTPEIMDQIGVDYCIPVEMRDEIGLALEFGAREYAFETQRAALDFEGIRKDLRALDKAAKSMLSALETISPDTQRILHEAGVGRTLKELDLPRVSALDGEALLHFAASPDQPPQCISLDDVRSILAALDQCATDARPAATASRKGRPDQQGLWDLLHTGFQVWASGLGRPFKLDWASNGDPITDAARFSVRISHVVDPSLTLRQIATASRKVREMSFKLSDLSEFPDAVEHYRKRFE
jgi:hypothetical protein